MNRAGSYSTAVTLDPALTPELRDEDPAVGPGAEEEWETNAGGDWEFAVPATGNARTTGGLEQHADGYLEFTGSDLTGTYLTSWDDGGLLGVIDQSQPPTKMLVMAAVEAEQVHPTTIGDLGLTLGSLEAQRWTFEGPAWLADGDTPNCSLAIQIRLNVDGTATGWTEWQPFACGVYEVVDFRLRLLATRPDATYNIKIHRFHTKVGFPRRLLEEQDTRALFARSEII